MSDGYIVLLLLIAFFAGNVTGLLVFELIHDPRGIWRRKK